MSVIAGDSQRRLRFRDSVFPSAKEREIEIGKAYVIIFSNIALGIGTWTSQSDGPPKRRNKCGVLSSLSANDICFASSWSIEKG